MICSQKFVPLVSGTTLQSCKRWSSPLWFALKSLYLWYLEQRHFAHCYLGVRCDLLSKVCTFGIWNNTLKKWITAKRLWFALKSLYLWYLEQLITSSVSRYHSCDLLSKVCTFGIWNNTYESTLSTEMVVICSQKFVPLVSGTTRWMKTTGRWSCDLLSKVCTFGIWNNLSCWKDR